MKKKDDIYIIMILILILDRFIKHLVIKNMNLLQSITVINNFFNITYIKNTGAAWGILASSKYLLIIISLLVFIYIMKTINNKKTFFKMEIISLGLIMGGLVGNLLDRILYNGVIDYLDFIIFNYNFPIFNLADIAIVIGVILMIIICIKERNVKNG